MASTFVEAAKQQHNTKQSTNSKHANKRVGVDLKNCVWYLQTYINRMRAQRMRLHQKHFKWIRNNSNFLCVSLNKCSSCWKSFWWMISALNRSKTHFIESNLSCKKSSTAFQHDDSAKLIYIPLVNKLILFFRVVSNQYQNWSLFRSRTYELQTNSDILISIFYIPRLF